MSEHVTSDEVLHVVALSGGKDSTAMALRLAETEPRKYLYVCTPTGNELPEMFAHWRKLGELLGAPITPVIGGTLRGVIEQEGMIPNFRARFCTRMLKIEPFAAWLMRQDRPVVSYVGLRADEPEREAGDYTNVPGVTLRFPLREWGWGLRRVLRVPRRARSRDPAAHRLRMVFLSDARRMVEPVALLSRRVRRGRGDRDRYGVHLSQSRPRFLAGTARGTAQALRTRRNPARCRLAARPVCQAEVPGV